MKRRRGKQLGRALVKWLNAPSEKDKWYYSHRHKPFIEAILADAQVVFGNLAEHDSLHSFSVAVRSGSKHSEFWRCYYRLNEELSKFTSAPQIELHEYYDGSPVSLTLTTEESPIAVVSGQVRCLLQLMLDREITNVRRCPQCTKWYFARRSDQEFCTAACRCKCHSKTEAFKERRRRYMRKLYALHKSGKVK